jgi:hypothetical protein
MGGDRAGRVVEEVDVQGKPHSEGVDASATWDQEPGPGCIPVE